MSSIEDDLDEISDICRKIAKRDFSSLEKLEAFSLKDSKTIAQLAEDISFMVVQLQAREFELELMLERIKKSNEKLERAEAKLKEKNLKLLDEIHDLKIQVDKKQKEEEVSSIAETPFFKKIKKSKHERKKRKP